MGFSPTVSRGSPFSWSNFPFGVISTTGNPVTRCATAIGDFAIDLAVLSNRGILKDEAVQDAFSNTDLSKFAALPAPIRFSSREKIIEAVRAAEVPEDCFVPLADVTMHLPMEIKGFTDFLTSIEHLQNCAPLGNRPIPKNFFQVPTAYNGRASGIKPSPHLFHRINGVHWEVQDDNTQRAVFSPSECIDFELELASLIGTPVPYGETISADKASDYIFGFVLLNDWSARDLQHFEMPPLGPMNSKAYASTISPWVVTLDALAPFTCEPQHEATLKSPFAHLRVASAKVATFDIKLEAYLQRQGKEYKLCSSNLRSLLWTPFQQLAHQASSGCGFRTGDLLGTGTISGDGVDGEGKKTGLGCLLEATELGKKPVIFEDGTSVMYLEDGDSVVLRGFCGSSVGSDGSVDCGTGGLGFGDCVGTVLASR